MKINIKEWLKIIDRKLEVTAKYDDDEKEKWNATIEGSFFIRRSTKGSFENQAGGYVRAAGGTPKGAIANLVNIIRGKTLIERDPKGFHCFYCPKELDEEIQETKKPSLKIGTAKGFLQKQEE